MGSFQASECINLKLEAEKIRKSILAVCSGMERGLDLSGRHSKDKMN